MENLHAEGNGKEICGKERIVSGSVTFLWRKRCWWEGGVHQADYLISAEHEIPD